MNNKYFTYTKQTLNTINQIKLNNKELLLKKDLPKSNVNIDYATKQCLHYKQYLVDEIYLHQMNADERKVYKLLTKSNVYNIHKILYHKYNKFLYKLSDFGLAIKTLINNQNNQNNKHNEPISNVKVNNSKDVNILFPKVSTNLYDCYILLTKLKQSGKVNELFDDYTYIRTAKMLNILNFKTDNI